MTKEYYECHITMEGDKDAIRKAVANTSWIFSAIDNDITLGEGVKCYATRHVNIRQPIEDVIGSLEDVSTLLEFLGCKIIRKKVEAVIYDVRTP